MKNTELNKLETLILSRLELMEGNCGCDYHRNCIIYECRNEIRKLFSEIKKEEGDE